MELERTAHVRAGVLDLRDLLSRDRLLLRGHQDRLNLVSSAMYQQNCGMLSGLVATAAYSLVAYVKAVSST